MRGIIGILTLSALLSFAAISGCGGGEDEVLDYDPEASKQKAAEYEQQMKDAMKNRGRPGRRSPK